MAPPVPNGVMGGLGEHQKCRGTRSQAKSSELKSTPSEELHDIICIGFGPASLAIAIALHDTLASPDCSKTLSQLGPSRKPKVLFLERQPRFAWHAGMLLPGAKMQISFIKDLATLRNPRSEFTFLNYLHSQNRLVQFSNLGTFNPLRVEFEDYMRWCAGSFEEVVDYAQEVSQIVPEKFLTGSSKVDSFAVRSRDLRTGEFRNRRARHVVIAIGGTPRIPKSLPQHHPRIIHSSGYSTVVPALLNDKDKDYHIAVIGGGQSAAEIFNDLHSKYPNARTTLLIKGGALHPSDDSPFVNEIFHPSGVDDVYQRPPEVRKASIAHDRGTNYGVVCRELLESLYADMYTQRLLNSNEEEWQHRIRPYRKAASAEDVPGSNNRVRLHIRNSSGIYEKDSVCCDERLDVDAVLVATGYVRDAHEEMLRPARYLMKGGDEPGKKWSVTRNYRVRFDEGKVCENAGVWLQGCNESTHGKDEVRTRSYQNAIYQNRHIFKDKIVLDVGCGTAILSMFAVKAGARHVVGVDMSTIIDKAKDIVEANGMSEKITLIQGKMEEVELPFPTVDIIISEWMGYFLLYESMLDTVLYARDKYLAPKGLIFPDKATIFMAGIEDGEYKEEKIGFWDNVYGFDYTPLKETALTEPLVDTVDLKAVVTDPTPVLTLDLYTVQPSDLAFSSPFTLDVRRDDFIHALIAWFDIDFTACHKPIRFSTGPHTKYTHWKQTVFYLRDVLTVQQGEKISGVLENKPNDKNKRDLDVTIHYKLETSDELREAEGTCNYKM